MKEIKQIRFQELIDAIFLEALLVAWLQDSDTSRLDERAREYWLDVVSKKK
jgi:hypothetical protein